MNRRSFFQTGGGVLAAAPLAMARPAARKVKMHVGTQHSHEDGVLSVLSSLGVNHICSTDLGDQLDDSWSVEGLSKLRERVEKHGVSLDMVPLPLPSATIGKAPMASIMLGRSPERDRQIEMCQQMIRNCARAGIPAVKYNMSILGVVRLPARSKGRGESTYSAWNYNEAPDKDKLTEAGRVSADEYWERIDYFLARVAPVANEEKIRMACHPHDPGMPEPAGYRGVHTVLGSPAGLKKFVSMHENPYHGLNFCQGTVSEMLHDPNREIHDLIRYFGSRKKIFNVHFRNIHGTFGDFQETFPDNGSVNMIDAVRTYQEVGYEYMLMPDHVPQIPGDKGGAQAFAYAFGYIQALLQMLG
jgi:mannonate dehydratase